MVKGGQTTNFFWQKNETGERHKCIRGKCIVQEKNHNLKSMLFGNGWQGLSSRLMWSWAKYEDWFYIKALLLVCHSWYSLNKPTCFHKKRKYQMHHICLFFFPLSTHFLWCLKEKTSLYKTNVLTVKHNSSITSQHVSVCVNVCLHPWETGQEREGRLKPQWWQKVGLCWWPHHTTRTGSSSGTVSPISLCAFSLLCKCLSFICYISL